ncbi:MAG: nucleotidyltransferase family protein [Prolixibacteraceae bacterium]
MYTREQIVDFISQNKSFLRDTFHINKIGLFGSFARNEQSEKSDIDLIVEFEEKTEDLYDIKIELKKFFKKQLGIKVDVCREKYIKPGYKDRILNETIYVD